MQAVLDRPVAAHRRGGIGRGEGTRGDEVAGVGTGRAPAFDAGLCADEAGGAGQTQLAREAASAREPVDLAEHGDAALLDAAMALVEVDRGLEHGGLGEGGLDLAPERGLIGLDREQVVRALDGDRLGDVLVGGDGIDGDQRPLQPVVGAEPFEQRRDRGQLVRLVGHGFLGQHQPGGGGEGGHEVKRRGALAPVVAAARGLAVDRHQTGLVRPALPHPAREGGGEERRVDPVHQDGEPALTRDAVRVRQLPAEEVEVRRAPGGDVLVVVAVGDGAADHQEQDLGSGCRIRRTSRGSSTCAK